MATKKASTTTAKKAAKSATTEAEAPKPAKQAAVTKAPAKSAATKNAAAKESATSTKQSATHDEIAKHAHGLWEKGGRHHGSHVDHWLRAEKELNG